MVYLRKRVVTRTALFFAALSLKTFSLDSPDIFPESGDIVVPALVKISNPNLSGAIFYTTDGTDPRGHGGKVGSSAQVYADSFESHDFGDRLAVNRSMVVRCRVKSGEVWSEMNTVTFVADQDFSNLLFTEIMFHPTNGPPESEIEEFIEFKNIGKSTLNLSGLRIVDFTEAGNNSYLKYTFPEGVVAHPGEFLVVAANAEKFQSLYPDIPFNGGMMSRLNNQIGRIALIGPDSGIATQMRYETHYPWPAIPDNHGYFKKSEPKVGFSLTRRTLDLRSDPEHYSTWRASAARLGSPGKEDVDPKIPPLVVNEFRSRSTGQMVDRVEIYNPTLDAVSIAGWWLSYKRSRPYKHKFPENTVVPAKGYLVVDEADFCAAGSKMSLSSKGDRCYLFSATPGGELTGYSHGVRFEGSDENMSFGRSRTSEGIDYFQPELSESFGLENNGSSPIPLLISEVMYHPDVGGFQYIELHNQSKAPLSLWLPETPARTWGLSGGSIGQKGPQFLFPEGTTVLPDAYLICIPESTGPIEAPSGAQVFRVPDEIFSTKQGVLRLHRPLASKGEKIRFVTADEAIYQNRLPWDVGASGGGQGLERTNTNSFGVDPLNWSAGPVGGTPGRSW